MEPLIKRVVNGTCGKHKATIKTAKMEAHIGHKYNKETIGCDVDVLGIELHKLNVVARFLSSKHSKVELMFASTLVIRLPLTP